MKENKSLTSYLTPRALFFGVWAVIALCSVAYLIGTHGAVLDNIVYSRGTDRFMDFFNHISYTKEESANVYAAGINACFPPFIYIMYYFLGRLIPDSAIVRYYCMETGSYALLLYVWFSAMVAVALTLTIMKMTEKWKSGVCRIALTGIILTSNIFIFYILERGNSAVIACLFIMWAIILRDSEKKYQRELALIMIAIAAAIKVYPAVFGLLYLFEKRWKEAVRLIIYGLIFFFVPFLFFGGFEGIRLFFSNQMSVQNMGYSGLNSIKALCRYVSNVPQTAANILVIVYFLLAAGAAFFGRDLWKKVYLLSSIMVLCPFWSGDYTLIYFVIPLILFLVDVSDRNNLSAPDYAYAVLFAAIFSFFTITSETVSNSTGLGTIVIVEYVPVYIMSILLIIDGISAGARKMKSQYIRKGR